MDNPTLLLVENGWTGGRLYFSDTVEGLTKAKVAVKEQNKLNALKNPNYPDEVFLSRIRAEKEEEPVVYSSSDDDEQEED